MNEQKTLRDEFAMAALIGAISIPAYQRESYDVYAERAYAMADAMLAERSKNEPKADADGWIEWNGGKCPVTEDCNVEVRLKDFTIHAAVAGEFYWHHENYAGDIIAYRVKVIK